MERIKGPVEKPVGLLILLLKWKIVIIEKNNVCVETDKI